MVFKIFSASPDFTVIFNILMWLMQKALQQTLLIGYLLQNCLINLEVYLKNVKILLECRYCLVFSKSLEPIKFCKSSAVSLLA
jgi:hypothetical protein